MSNRDDRYYNSHRAQSPVADQRGVFFQGGRTLLPIPSAFPITHFPGLFFLHSILNRNTQSARHNVQWTFNLASILNRVLHPGDPSTNSQTIINGSLTVLVSPGCVRTLCITNSGACSKQ